MPVWYLAVSKPADAWSCIQVTVCVTLHFITLQLSFFYCYVQHRESIRVKCTRNQLFTRLWPIDWNLRGVVSTFCALPYAEQGALAKFLGIGFTLEFIRRWSRHECTEMKFYGLVPKTGKQLPGTPVCDSFLKCSPWSAGPEGRMMLHRHQHTTAESYPSSPSPRPCQITISKWPKRERIMPPWSLRDWTKEKLNVMKQYIGSLKIDSSKCSTAHLHPNPET